MFDKSVFADAIDILERDGWCQRADTNHRGEHCIRGAFVLAAQVRMGAGWGVTANQAWAALEAHLCRNPITWNDGPKRTYGEVIAVLAHLAQIEVPEISIADGSVPELAAV